jgi:hypothetical protein
MGSSSASVARASWALLAGLAIVALLGCIWTSSASGTVLCEESATLHCPSPYGKNVAVEAHLKTGTKWALNSGSKTFECEEASIAGEVTNPGGTNASVSGAMTALSVGKCNGFASVNETGFFKISSPSGGNGALSLEGFEAMVFDGGFCVYVGTASATLSGGTPAAIKVSSSLAKKEGPSSCANSASLSAEYTVATPEPLYVASFGPASALCKTASYPCSGGAYGKGSKLELDLKSGTTSVVTEGLYGTHCQQVSIDAEVQSTAGTGNGVAGALSGFSFGNCNWGYETLKTGTFSVAYTGGHNGTITLSGFEIKSKATSCILTGPVTLSLTGGAMASAVVNAPLTKKSGFACPAENPWTAEFTVTAPEPLYVEEL